jgi:hypothetical protein
VRTSAGSVRLPDQGSVMTAMSFISEPHRGQTKGLSLSARARYAVRGRPPSRRASAPVGHGLPPERSISYTFAISLAHMEWGT